MSSRHTGVGSASSTPRATLAAVVLAAALVAAVALATVVATVTLAAAPAAATAADGSGIAGGAADAVTADAPGATATDATDSAPIDASSAVAPSSYGAAASQYCDDVEAPAVVATPPEDAPYRPGDTVRVYRGSELVVHLCDDVSVNESEEPPPDYRLDASGVDWVEVLSASGNRLRVRITGPDAADDADEQSDGAGGQSGASDGQSGDASRPDGSVASLGDLASPESVAGPNVTIVDVDVASDLVDGRLPVRSAEEARQLGAAGRAHREREAALEAGLDALGDATAAVESGAPADGAALNETVRAHEQYREAADDLREQLYTAADSGVGSASHAEALAELADREAAMAEATGERAREHDRALLERERSLTWALRLRVLGGGLLGLLVGTLLGAALPLYRGRAARRRLQRGEWTTYSRRTALLPAVVGLVLLLLGLGWLASEVGWQLLEVVT